MPHVLAADASRYLGASVGAQAEMGGDVEHESEECKADGGLHVD